MATWFEKYAYLIMTISPQHKMFSPAGITPFMYITQFLGKIHIMNIIVLNGYHSSHTP